MHRLVPEFIVDNYRAQRTRGSLKSVGMFVDLSGFSAMTDALMHHGQHGAEVLAGLMYSVFDPLVSSIFQNGGQVIGYAGDGITALFPVETDLQAAARRGLAAAWLMQRSLLAHPVQQTSYGTFNFSAKIGLAIGEVDWGILSSRDKATYYFRGAAVADSVAAESRARAGDIILAPSMFELLGTEVQTEALESFQRVLGVKADLPASGAIAALPVDFEISRLFVPEGVIAKDLRNEFRQVVNVFMRFPDLADEQLQNLMHNVFGLQQRYGGLLSKLDFGDKGNTLHILWGAPVAYENDMSRAIHFVFDLKASVDFPITVGVTYYIAHAGYQGSSLYEDYTCYGWGVNLAARLMSGAPLGQVWVDERVARRVMSYFDLEFIGAQRFKGFATEQKVFLLKGRKTQVEPEYQGEMVGREDEVARLEEFISPLWEGRFAGSIVIWGDAGIGKGRLVYEFRSSKLFASHPALWAICQADQIIRSPFNPFRYWLIHYFGLISGMTEEERRQAFDSKLDSLIAGTTDASLAGELNRLRSVLGALVDLHWPDSFYDELDAEGRYDNTLLALIALLKAESLRQPVILFWEDAQFIDEDSKNFLPRLKRALAAETMSYPVAIIATSRRHGLAVPFAEGLFDHSLELNSLSLGAISRLAEILLGDIPSGTLVQLLMDRSEGNPYFAEQIIYYLQEEKLLEMSRTGWTLVKRLDASIVPADVSAVLVARLDQLAREVRAVIQTAAVLGREFEVRVLAQMLRDDQALYDEIAEAEKAAIWSPLSQIRYLFTHGLLRDAAYWMQMRARRRELHFLALTTFETLYADEIEAHYGELAYHSEQAQITDKAFHYLQLAANAARDAYQNAHALEYYRRALVFVPQADLQTRFELHKECEKLLTEMRHLAGRAQELETLQALADRLVQKEAAAYVQYRKALLANARSKPAEAVAFAESAIQLSRAAGNVNLVVDGLVAQTHGYLRQGQFKEAAERGEQALVLARSESYSSGEADVLTTLGFVYYEMKDPASGIEFSEKALALYRSLGNLRGETMPLNNLGLIASAQGNFSSALEYYERSLQLARQIGARKVEVGVLGNLGWLSGLLGEYAKARHYSERQLIIAREIGDRYYETLSLINLSGQVTALGYPSTGMTFAKRALALAQESGDRSLQAWSQTYLGHCLLAAGLSQDANEAYGAAVTLWMELDQPILETEPRAGLARTFLVLNDIPKAADSAEKVLAHLAAGKSLDGTDEPARIYLDCYHVLKAAQDQRADQLLGIAYEMINTRAASIRDAAARQSFLENVPHNREIIGLWRNTAPA